jgi:hypothetical protein
MRPSDRIRISTIGVIATVSTAAVLLAGCVSAGSQALGPAEDDSLVRFRAAERVTSVTAGASEAASLVRFRAAERVTSVTAGSGGGGAGRYQR